MKTNNLFIAVSVAILATACVSKPPVETSNQAPPNPYAGLEQKIAGIQQDSEMPGLRVLVLERGEAKIDYTKGLRSLSSTKELQPKDKFVLGTATETFTAVLIGQLIDQKILSWDTKIKDLVPRDMPIHASHRETTIEMLLAQRAGLTDVFSVQAKKLWPQMYKGDSKANRLRLTRAILLNPPRFAPGSKVEHSPAAFIVLGWILEHKTNFNWEELVQNKIFADFFMDSCGFGAPATPPTPAIPEPNQPYGHSLDKNGKLESVKPGSHTQDWPRAFGPAGTIHCSAEDWGKFLQMLAQGFYQDSAALGKETFEKLLANSASSAYTRSGLLRYERAWSAGEALAQSGKHPSNFAMTAVAPSRELVIIVMTNSGTKQAEQGTAKIIQLLTEIK